MGLGSLSSPPSGGDGGLGVVLAEALSVGLAIPEEEKAVRAGAVCPRSLGSCGWAALPVIPPPM